MTIYQLESWIQIKKSSLHPLLWYAVLFWLLVFSLWMEDSYMEIKGVSQCMFDGEQLVAYTGWEEIKLPSLMQTRRQCQDQA